MGRPRERPTCQFLLSVGLREDLMGWDVHEGDGLAQFLLLVGLREDLMDGRLACKKM
jgi:hypothetical protein